MTLLIGRVGVAAIPIAFAVMAALETAALGIMFMLKLQRRMASGVGGPRMRPVYRPGSQEAYKALKRSNGLRQSRQW
jgi:hypothetical protein